MSEKHDQIGGASNCPYARNKLEHTNLLQFGAQGITCAVARAWEGYRVHVGAGGGSLDDLVDASIGIL